MKSSLSAGAEGALQNKLSVISSLTERARSIEKQTKNISQKQFNDGKSVCMSVNAYAKTFRCQCIDGKIPHGCNY